MENTELNKLPRKQQIGSKPFLVVVTAIISVFATIMVIYYINGGVVLMRNSIYGDLHEVIPVAEVIDNIEKEYYTHDGEIPSSSDMVLTAMNAIVDRLEDPYSAYYTAEEYESYHNTVSSSFKGLGISMDVNDSAGTRIVEVMEDSPAEKAGLKTGDIIVSVNGTIVADLESDRLRELLKGEDGEKVVIDVMRGEEMIKITAYYGEVIVKTVHGSMLNEETGYIYISQFADNTAKEFDEKADELRGLNMKSLIIDVRNNPGGYLDSVVSVADSILDGGTIVSIGNTLEDPNLETYEAKEGGIDLPIVLLINENSASSSEILAAAIKENKAGILVGMTTFGKGIVQTTGQLYSTDGYLKLTTSAYYTPDGNDIHMRGVAPDVTQDMDEGLKEYIGSETPNAESDTQLKRALEELGQG